MAKATINDITGLGFNAAQFGAQTDFSAAAAGGYVFDVLTDMAIQVRRRIGATRYDAANKAGTDDQQLDFSNIKQAETYLTAAELWRRRAAYADSATALSRNFADLGPLIDSYRRNANAAEEKGWDFVVQVTGVSRDGSISTGIVETGLYPAVNN